MSLERLKISLVGDRENAKEHLARGSMKTMEDYRFITGQIRAYDNLINQIEDEIKKETQDE